MEYFVFYLNGSQSTNYFWRDPISKMNENGADRDNDNQESFLKMQ